MTDTPMLPPLPAPMEDRLNAMALAYEQMGRRQRDGAEYLVASHAAFEAEYALRAALLDENERLRKALEDLLGVADAHCLRMEPCEGYECDCWQRAVAVAHAALAGQKP